VRVRSKNLMGFTCQKLGKSYQTRNGVVCALEDVTFSVRDGEFICIVGPSGCGKSTLLRILAGLLEQTSGRIVFDSGTTNQRRNALVFQEHGLYPWMTVLDNVAFGLEAQGVGRRERREKAGVFIERMGLARFAESYPHELSVGMRQRVGIARALLVDPQMLLMDEPFASLDAQTKQVLQLELLRIWREYRKSVVYITHDIEEAVVLSDRVLVMTGHPGRIREEISIPLVRPRDPSDREQAGQISEIRWRIWKILEEEVQRSLGVSPSR
jgi:NitT/TauT family transport system ATP-binding protein